MSFGSSTFFIILLYLIREESIKDLVDQLGGGRFSWPLAVLLDLRRVANGLPSGSSPVKKNKVCIQRRGPFGMAQIPDDMWSSSIMKPWPSTHHSIRPCNKTSKQNQTHSKKMYNAEFPLDATG